MTETILKFAVTVVGAGGMGALLTYKLGNRKQDTTEFTALVIEYKTLVDGYKLEVVELRKNLEDLRDLLSAKGQEVTNLRYQLMVFEGSYFNLPLPMWMKDIKGRLIFMNESCQELILEPLGLKIEDYLGKTDLEFWDDKEFAKQFGPADAKVLRTKKPLEIVHTFLDANKEEVKARILKYPRFHGSEIIGIGGLIRHIIEDNG